MKIEYSIVSGAPTIFHHLSGSMYVSFGFVSISHRVIQNEVNWIIIKLYKVYYIILYKMMIDRKYIGLFICILLLSFVRPFVISIDSLFFLFNEFSQLFFFFFLRVYRFTHRHRNWKLLTFFQKSYLIYICPG